MASLPDLPLGGWQRGVGVGPDMRLNERPRPERVPGPWRIELKLCDRSRVNLAATTRGEQAAHAQQRSSAGGGDDVEVQH